MRRATMTDRLTRTLFTVSRDAEYFRASELQAQTGQPRSRFAAVALKELVDNAMDAAEAIERAPNIALEVTSDGDTLRLTVGDNGSGMDTETLRRILDFGTRTSDKAAYRAPTRGLQGNALKTILGMPTALGSDAPVVVTSRGRRHEIRARIRPAGDVDVEHHVAEGPTAVGTTIALTIPAPDQDLDAIAWARGFALVNPHASVKIRVTPNPDNLWSRRADADRRFLPRHGRLPRGVAQVPANRHDGPRLVRRGRAADPGL